LPTTQLRGAVKAASGIAIVPDLISMVDVFDENGTRVNKSKLIVPFTSEIVLIDSTQIALRGKVLNPLTNTINSIDIPILSAIIDSQDHRRLIIITGQLLPTNTRLSIHNGALRSPQGEDISAIKIMLRQGNLLPDATLAVRPFKASNINM